MDIINLLIILLVPFTCWGFLLEIRAVRRLVRLKFVSGSLQGFSGALIIAFCAVTGGIAMNLYTYYRLTHEQAVADINFQKLGEQRYLATLRPARSQVVSSWEIHGDEWQIDARFIKWNGVANILGIDSVFRLERLSGRYKSIEQERNGKRTVISIAKDNGLDIWDIARSNPEYIPGFDAIYGSATYLPMADNSTWRIKATQSGLIARPVNSQAFNAVKNWE